MAIAWVVFDDASRWASSTGRGGSRCSRSSRSRSQSSRRGCARRSIAGGDPRAARRDPARASEPRRRPRIGHRRDASWRAAPTPPRRATRSARAPGRSRGRRWRCSPAGHRPSGPASTCGDRAPEIKGLLLPFAGGALRSAARVHDRRALLRRRRRRPPVGCPERRRATGAPSACGSRCCAEAAPSAFSRPSGSIASRRSPSGLRRSWACSPPRQRWRSSAPTCSSASSMARTDDLTGLPNRRSWFEELPRELARGAATSTPSASRCSTSTASRTTTTATATSPATAC